jgi:sulfatase modifying factor 1
MAQLKDENELRMKKPFKKIILGIVAALCLVALPFQAHAKPAKAKTNIEAAKEHLVLMPLRLSEEDKNLQGAMEAALVNGLQQKYEVFSGEQVSKKAREIFLKESRNTTHKECDEIRCLQGIAEAFQAELLATANITKQDGGYFIALSIQNLYDNKVVQSESVACEGCNAFKVIEKLKEIVGAAARITSAPSAEELQPGKVVKDCPDCPEMVVVPAGSFDMGSPSTEAGRYDNESPVHHVNVKAFMMGRTNITRGQFFAFVTATNYDAGKKCNTFEDGKNEWRVGRNWLNPGYPQQDNHPVACIDWNDAKAYADWLSRKTGKPYSLPTEAEWEYAARAGTTTASYWGDNPDQACDYANVADQSLKSQAADNKAISLNLNCNDGFAYTSPVGSFKPNPFGLYDIQGNIWQWLADSYHDNYNGAPGDGSEWQGDGEVRVVRGGSWIIHPLETRSAMRFGYKASIRNGMGGFRLARTLP